MMSAEDTDQDQEGEAVSGSHCLKGDQDLTQSFEVVLKDLPEVYMYIQRLNQHIKKQQYTLVKLFEKLKEYRQTAPTKMKAEMKSASTQTDNLAEQPNILNKGLLKMNATDHRSKWMSPSGAEGGRSLADEVKQVAESAMQQTGFVYEETSGMYYDYNTGYYYNAEMGLYYDGNSGAYLYYNESTKSYEFHSQAATSAPVAAEPSVLPPTPSIPVLEKTATEKVVEKTAVEEVMEKPRKPKTVPLKVVPPDPLEAKETDFYIPGSNPMAPVLSESSSVSSPRDSYSDVKSPKEIKSLKEVKSSKVSKHERKRKGKHKKHKSKKKKKRRHKSLTRSENGLEEGECTDTSESELERENEKPMTEAAARTTEEVSSKDVLSTIECDSEIPICLNVTHAQRTHRSLSDEASEAWPPCMRIIVQSTEVKNFNVGTLFIVTCKGGTLGREKFHAVSVPDINISKHHGIFTFDESSGKYFLTDYGSRNGTYVNKQRLSSAKQESEPCEISHGTIVTLGSTNLLCHIHPGRETCEDCEPGVVAAKRAEEAEPSHPLQPSSNIGESKSERRLQELRRLRKRFGLEGNETKSDLAPGYEDRAEIRRVTVGSHNEHAKTEMASATESIRSTNKGFKMLAKMGWKEGESLGRDGTGLTEPVLVSQRADKAGLGAEASYAAAPAPRPRIKADRWQRARERYGQLPDTLDGNDE